MCKRSSHHVFLLLFGSLAFFVSACSQHNTENNDTEKNDVDVVATPATATNLPAGDPKGGSETGESDNDSVTTTANGKARQPEQIQ